MTGYSKRAVAYSVINAHNTCPVCGFPLAWGRECDADDLTSSDTLWYLAQTTLRELGPGLGRAGEKISFGNVRGVNGQQFHYTDRECTREFGRPCLYRTPGRRTVYPEPPFYVQVVPPNVRRSLFHFTRAELQHLLPMNLPGYALRTSFFEEVGVASNNITYACAECNQTYSVGQRVQWLLADVLGLPLPQDQDDYAIPTENAFYTLVFDCMAQPGTEYIEADTRRRRTWQAELWMVRTLILITAHHSRSASGIDDRKWLKRCHMDMGCLDFLTSQLLGMLLMANFDFPNTSYRQLHQNYLSRLAYWAHVNEMTNIPSANKTPCCLWKWVFGQRVAGSPRRTLLHGANNNYLMAMAPTGSVDAAGLLKDRFIDFAAEWVPIIGHALLGTMPGPGVDGALVLRLNTFFQLFGPNYIESMRTMPNESLLAPEVTRLLLHKPYSLVPVPDQAALFNIAFSDHVLLYHSIAGVEAKFREKFGVALDAAFPMYRRIMYHHLIETQIRRMDYYAELTRGRILRNDATWLVALHWLHEFLILA